MRSSLIAVILMACSLALFGCGGHCPLAGSSMPKGVSKSKFGKNPDGTPIEQYTLKNSKDMVVKVINYGGIITSIQVPDRNGVMGDVVLGFDNADDYQTKSPYFGCITGRYANRICKGQFTLNGKTYTLAINNTPNSLHGGVKGFDKIFWNVTPITNGGSPALKLTYVSHDGEEGYPGKLTTTVIYTLTDNNELIIDYMADAESPTIVNLTSHSYFNLAGQGTILNHELMLAADAFTPVDSTLIPTGEIKKTAGTVMDFAKPTKIGSRIQQVGGDPIGYDHNYVLNGGSSKTPVLAATLYEPSTGRYMEMLTTEPGVQFYTGNFLDGTLVGKGGRVYQQHSALCLEAQHFPDSPNQPKFPSTVLNPGEIYTQTTIYKFSTK